MLKAGFAVSALVAAALAVPTAANAAPVAPSTPTDCVTYDPGLFVHPITGEILGWVIGGKCFGGTGLYYISITCPNGTVTTDPRPNDVSDSETSGTFCPPGPQPDQSKIVFHFV